jgi:hypothetical protein
MEIRVTTPLDQSVNDEVCLFKYERGRYLALAVALLFLGGGVGLPFLGGIALIIGVILILVGFLFSLGFTLGWKSTRKRIVLDERKRNPVQKGATLEAVFSDDKAAFTLKKYGSSPMEEEHPYSYFSAVEVTEHYLYFVYGDPKANPAIPVQRSENLLAFLKDKGIKIHYHKGSLGLA